MAVIASSSLSTAGTPVRATTFTAVSSPSPPALSSLPQRASSFAAIVPSPSSPSLPSSLSPSPIPSTHRPILSARRHTMRPLRSSPLAGPSLALSANPVSPTSDDDVDADVSSAACGGGSVYGYGSSSSEHHGGKGQVVNSTDVAKSAPASLRFPAGTAEIFEDVHRDEGAHHDEGRKAEGVHKLKKKKRASSGFGLTKLPPFPSHASSESRDGQHEARPVSPPLPASHASHLRSDTSHELAGPTSSTYPHRSMSASVITSSSSSAASIKAPEPARTKRRSSMLPPVHSSAYGGSSVALGTPRPSSVQTTYARRSLSYQGGALGPAQRAHPRTATDSPPPLPHEHWLTAVPNQPLTEIVKAMADPKSPEATWLQVVAPPKFTRAGIASQGVVMPVRKADKGAVMGKRQSLGAGAAASASAAMANGAAAKRMDPDGHGRMRTRSTLVGSGTGFGHVRDKEAAMGKGKEKERERGRVPDIQEVQRDAADDLRPPRAIPPRADSQASVSSHESQRSLDISMALARSESPLSTLSKKVSTELARTEAQQPREPDQVSQRLSQPRLREDYARRLLQLSAPFTDKRLSRATSASSLVSTASYHTALEIPLSPPSPPFAQSEHAPGAASEESLASKCSSPPELGGGGGHETSMGTPSLTRSRTLSTSDASLGASVKLVGMFAKDDGPGAKGKESHAAAARVVEVMVNDEPVELVKLPSASVEVHVAPPPLPSIPQSPTKGRSTLRKKNAYTQKGSAARGETSPVADERKDLKRGNGGGTIKKVWRRIFRLQRVDER